jgi:PAS domain S-box-containing protein
MHRNDHVTPGQKRPSAEFPFGADFEAILTLIGDGVVSTDHNGRIILFNRAAEEIFGYTVSEVLGRSIETLIPTRFHDQHLEDVSRFCALDTPLRRSMGAGREVSGRRKDGQELAIEATLSRQLIGGEHIVTAVVRDVSDRKVVEKHHRVVANEVAHRLRNTMAVVNSIVTLTARTAPSVVEFKEALLGRFTAISRTNDSLVRGSWTEASVRRLLETELAPYGDKEGKITLTGPDVSIDGHLAVALALVLHELATNAAKYGALSTSAGLLRVDWRVSAGTTSLLELIWEELGGPAVTPPTRRGFGSQLIARSLAPHGGEAASTYAPQGVSCIISLPLRNDGTGLST